MAGYSQTWRNHQKAMLLFCLLLMVSCHHHVHTLPVFPDVKIFNIEMPRTIHAGCQVEWVVWVNTAADSLYVYTYYHYSDEPIFIQYGKFYHTQCPVSGISANWSGKDAGLYRLVFIVKNRWREHQREKWITVARNHTVIPY